MPPSKPQKTLADYVAIAFCPALIMALVGSLMFFLLEVLYGGPHNDRMRWAVICFVVGIVLIARISMMSEIAERAGLYGIALAIAAGLVINKYIEYPKDSALAPIGWLINLVIMAILWWSAHRLTWDCTLIDDDADASGQGLLEAAGLEKKTVEAAKPQAEELPKEATDPALSWWERWRARRQHRKAGHTPGIWIVYYSLAALPLFGLGQIMIPASDGERRRYAFWLLAIYVAAGLGLLLATSFLGLRRYLRQRKLQMPAAMTGAWFAVGGGFVAALLALAFLLPRPTPEYYNVVNALTGGDHKSTRFDVLGGEGAKKGDGQRSGTGKSKKPGGSGKSQGGKGKQDSKQSGGKEGSKGKSGKGQDGGNSKDGQETKGGDSGGKDKSGKNSKDGKQSGDKNGDSSKNEGDDREKSESERQKRDGNDKKRDQKPEDDKKSEEEKKAEEEKNEDESSNEEDPETDKPDWVGTTIRWLFYIVAALVGAYVLWRYWREILAMLRGFWDALRELLARLLGGWQRRRADDELVEGETYPEPPPPFASFRNPFLDGTVDARTVNYVTRYTFAALQAWAYERGLGRSPQETAIEFCNRLADELPPLAANAQKLGDDYSRVSYARATLGRHVLDAQQNLWQRMTAPVRQPAGV